MTVTVLVADRGSGWRGLCGNVINITFLLLLFIDLPFEFRLRQCNKEYLDKCERTAGVPILIPIGSYPQLEPTSNTTRSPTANSQYLVRS